MKRKSGKTTKKPNDAVWGKKISRILAGLYVMPPRVRERFEEAIRKLSECYIARITVILLRKDLERAKSRLESLRGLLRTFQRLCAMEDMGPMGRKP